MTDSSEPRAARLSVVWHGFVREKTDGVVTREEGTGCRLEVHEDGGWLICGDDGCVVTASDDPARHACLVHCLLGKLGEEGMAGDGLSDSPTPGITSGALPLS